MESATNNMRIQQPDMPGSKFRQAIMKPILSTAILLRIKRDERKIGHGSGPAASDSVALAECAMKLSKDAAEYLARGKARKARRASFESAVRYSQASICPDLDAESSLKYHELAIGQFKAAQAKFAAVLEWTRRLASEMMRRSEFDVALKLKQEARLYESLACGSGSRIATEALLEDQRREKPFLQMKKGDTM